MGSGRDMVVGRLEGSMSYRGVVGSTEIGFAGSGRFPKLFRFEADSTAVVNMGLCVGVVARRKMTPG